ncbi:hypothetical protein N657DRAFT_709807 [Parathielavia appendiculata]|uniref:Uncharacterized protein n=1 Tax=Parathielavia appendiculata TaxID=2587402 RepID=A0AAN6Z5C2_9PEZI|nr:hypothetical protein N657DRAFT_709807 [Parathielavia appendiculata]
MVFAEEKSELIHFNKGCHMIPHSCSHGYVICLRSCIRHESDAYFLRIWLN